VPPTTRCACPSGLLAPVGIEYAAQAMALHGALNAKPGVDGRPGFLASARSVRLHVARLDDVAGALIVQVEHAGRRRAAGDVPLRTARRSRPAAAGRPRHRRAGHPAEPTP
jgi:predicted hotdog family 3-hydroxylacyl-ACP dehydratase